MSTEKAATTDTRDPFVSAAEEPPSYTPAGTPTPPDNPLMAALWLIRKSAPDTYIVVGTKRYALSDPALSGKALRAAVRLVIAELREVK